MEMAEVFNKTHRHVLGEIAKIIVKCSVKFSRENFSLTSYVEQHKIQPVCFLSRNAFALVGVHFKGVQAMEIKISYLSEFNRRELELNHQTLQKYQTERHELELERPWSEADEEKLVSYWRFNKSDTKALNQLLARMPLNDFGIVNHADLRQSFVNQFIDGLTQTKHDLHKVTAANRYSLALVILSEMGVRMACCLNEKLISQGEPGILCNKTTLESTIRICATCGTNINVVLFA